MKTNVDQEHLTSRVIAMHRISAEEQSVIVAGLMAVDDAVFVDRARSATEEKFQGKHSDETWIMVMENERRIVGYNCILIHHLRHKGKWISCWNSRAAVLPEYRGKNLTANFSLNHFFRFRTKYPFRRIYGLIALVHPSSFFLLAKKMPAHYPYPKRKLSPAEQEVYDNVYAYLNLEQIQGKPRFVIRHGTSSLTPPVEQEFWRKNPDPCMAFFHQYNGDYMHGQGISGFFEINVPMMSGIAWRLFRSKGGLKAIFPFLNRKSGMKSKIKGLENIPIFKGISKESLSKLASDKHAKYLKPGEYLFRKGDQERAMYLILSGSLYVILHTENEEIAVSQLQVGEFLGEFGLLYDVPRNASIKSFRNVELLRIDQSDIQTLCKLDHGVGQEIYGTIGRRMADNWLRFDSDYAHLDHLDRLDFIKSLPTLYLEKGMLLKQVTSSKCILTFGMVKVDGETLNAPRQFILSANTTLYAVDTSYILLISAPKSR